MLPPCACPWFGRTLYPLDRDDIRESEFSDFERGILGMLRREDVLLVLRDMISLADGTSSSMAPRLNVDVERKFDTDLERLSASDDTRLVNGEGASSSSLSLHPSPVVSPRPPRNSFPSR